MKEGNQVLQTRKKFSQALLDLITEKSFDQISVMDICNKAKLTRATFYKYYEDKYHLLHCIMHMYKENFLDKRLEDYHYTTPKDLYLKLASLYLEFAENNYDMLLRLVDQGYNEKLSMTILNSIAAYMDDLLQTQAENANYRVPVSILSKFFAGGFTFLSIYLLKNKDKYTKEQILDYLDKIMNLDSIKIQ